MATKEKGSPRLEFMRWFPMAYLSDEKVLALSLEAECAYFRLLNYLWKSGKEGEGIGLVDNDTILAALCRMTPEQFAGIKPELFDRSDAFVFFYKNGEGKWSNGRMDFEYESTMGIVQTRTRAALSSHHSPGARPPASPKPKKSKAPAKDTAANGKETWITPFADAWREVLGGEMAIGPALKPLRQVLESHPDQDVVAVWRQYLTDKGAYASAANFAAKYVVWLQDYEKSESAKPPVPSYHVITCECGLTYEAPTYPAPCPRCTGAASEQSHA